LFEGAKEYWVASTDVLKEYEQAQDSVGRANRKKGASHGSKVWYFQDQYIDDDRGRAVRKQLDTFFPDLTAE